MPTVQDVINDPDFAKLNSNDQRTVFDRVAQQDSDYTALTPKDQWLTRTHVLSRFNREQTNPSALPSTQSSVVGQIGSGMLKGAGDVLTSIPALIGALPSIPGAVASGVQGLVNNPATEGPAMAKSAARLAWGMVPFSETLGTLASGQLPTVENAARDVTRTGLSFVAPPVLGGLLKRGTRAFVKNMPGAGVELQSLAIQKADALANRLTPGQPAVRSAYESASQTGNPTIAMSGLRDAAQTILQHETQASQPNPTLIAQTQNILGSSEAGWNWQQAVSEVRRMGEQVRSYRKIHGEVPKEMTDLYSALRADVEQANPQSILQQAVPATPTGRLVNEQGQPLIKAQSAKPAVTEIGQPNAQTIATSSAWQDAQRLARRQFAAEDLQEQINKAIGTAGEGFNSFSVNKVLKWVQQQERAAQLGHPDTKARMFVQSWTPGELADIKATLSDISKNMAALPTMRGTPVGSSQRVQQAAIGALAGSVMGEAGIGSATGVLTADLIGQAMTTPFGRMMVRRATKIAPVTSRPFNQMLGAWLRQPPSQPMESQP